MVTHAGFLAVWENLTPREREFLAARCQGRTLQRIADEEFVAIKTVKNHLDNAHVKFFGKRSAREKGMGAGVALTNQLCFRYGYAVGYKRGKEKK